MSETLYGFGENKCKKEVYTKDESDNKYYEKSNVYTKIESDNKYNLKENFVVLRGFITTPEAEEESLTGFATIDYPTGLNRNNCIVIGLMAGRKNDGTILTTPMAENAVSALLGVSGLAVTLGENNITIRKEKISSSESSSTVPYKLILMKIDNDITGYELGDVNMDGVVNSDDLTLLNNYQLGTGALTERQFKLADMNSDGVLNSGDSFLLQQKIHEQE